MSTDGGGESEFPHYGRRRLLQVCAQQGAREAGRLHG